MYDYTYDEETGGLLLNDKSTMMSKEPRPVYAQELDCLGIDRYWHYERQQDVPYMWAEANNYIYRGQNIFKTVGGSLYQMPAITLINKKGPDGKPTDTLVLERGTVLQPVDLKAMCDKNRELLTIIEQVTLKKIYSVYKRYQKKLDCFHVAFSGGKDSIVLLDLVKRALPHKSFFVLFGDTQMEFPDTYALVDQVEELCREEDIAFYRSTSNYKTEESWRLFGPPSRVLRWCCSVHKSAPQTLKIREILRKKSYVGMDFVGVRRHESAARADYEENNFGKKQKGQYSHNPILEWTSAEIWMYIFTHDLPFNDTYKKGNSRAGCLYCPMGGGKADAFQFVSYNHEMEKYIDMIKEMDARDYGNLDALNSYVVNGGWNARKNGRDLTINEQRYFEETNAGNLIINVVNPKSDWHEWIKTLGIIPFNFNVKETGNGYTVTVNEVVLNKDPSFKKKFKQVFKKSAYCIGCRVCEANCRNGCISFNNGVRIENCVHCGQCHEIDSGCLVYNSLKLPLGGNIKVKSINSFANHAPKPEWIKQLVQKGNDYWDDNNLGPNQVPMFKKFLRACGFLNENNESTKLLVMLSQNGYDDPVVWGIACANFAYNAECSWYISRMQTGVTYSRDALVNMLIDDGVSRGDTTSVISAFKRFCDLPLGTVLHFGTVAMKGKQVVSATRTKMTSIDPRVLLYSLYRYAEECEGYYQFSVSTLMDTSINSAGISPVKIFGFTEEELEPVLRGLSAKYNDYIDVTFTHDLDKISLRDYHSSVDVLEML